MTLTLEQPPTQPAINPAKSTRAEFLERQRLNRQRDWQEGVERRVGAMAADPSISVEQRQMIARNDYHVWCEASSISRGWDLTREETSEAVADGYFGLVKAIVDNFDEGKVGSEASTHAKYISRSVRGEIQRGLRSRLGRGRYVTETRIVDGQEVTEEKYQDGTFRNKPSVMAGVNTADSLDAPLADDGISTLGDVIPAPSSQKPFTQALDRADILKVIKHLPERERKIFVLKVYGDFTQAEIAFNFGLQQMQISRLMRRMMERLEPALAAGI